MLQRGGRPRMVGRSRSRGLYEVRMRRGCEGEATYKKRPHMKGGHICDLYLECGHIRLGGLDI